MKKQISKIECCCLSGLGSSFLVGLNVQKALEELGIENVEVTHTSLSAISPGSADLYVCSTDIKNQVEKNGPVVAVNNLMSVEEIKLGIKEYLEI